MAKIFSLFGEVYVDNSKAKKELDDTAKKGESTGSKIMASMGTVAKGTLAVGTAVVGASTAVVGGLFAMTKKTADATDTIDKMSQRLGLSRTAYQEWDFVLSQCGVDVNSFQTGMKSLLKNMDAVGDGNKTAVDNFNKLGVSVQNTDGSMRSQEAVLYDTVKAFQSMDDSAEKSRLAQELFGKQGQEIIPLLNAQSGSLDEMKNMAHELGVVLDDETVDAGVTFTDTLDQIQRVLQNLVVKVGAVVMPIFQKVMDAFIKAVPYIQKLFEQLAPVIFSTLEGLLPPLMQLAEAIFPILMDLFNQIMPVIIQLCQQLLPVVVQLLELLLPPIIQIISVLLPPLMQILTALLPLIQPVISIIQTIIEVALMPIIEIITEIINILSVMLVDAINFLMPIIQLVAQVFNAVFGPLFKIVSTPIKLIIDIIVGAFKGSFDIIMSVINTVLSVFKSVFGVLYDIFYTPISKIVGYIGGAFKTAFDTLAGVVNGIKTVFTNVFDSIKEIVKAPINWVIDGLNTFIKGVNKIKIPDWVPAVGGKGLNFSLIKKLRVGMDYVPYDEMPAILHKGEAVLTADENKKYKENRNASSDGVVNNFTNNFNIEKVEIREESDIEKIARELYYMQRKAVL